MGRMRPYMGSASVSEGTNPYGTVGGLSGVSDPEKAYAAITRGEYQDYVRDFRQYELDLIEKASTDTRLIDQAREDIAASQGQAAGVARRNVGRYGGQLTPAQQQQQQAQLQRANTLGGVQSIADARIAQREANQSLLGDLINIGQGVNRSSIDQMGNAATDANARQRAYEQSRAASKAQTAATVGALGSSAILAAAIFF